MNTKTIQLLSAMAQRLGTTVKYLWGVEVREGYVQSLLNSIGALICLICGVTLVFVCRHFYKKQAGRKQWSDLESCWIWASLFGILIAAGVFIYCVLSAVDAFLNPANYALTAISFLF